MGMNWCTLVLPLNDHCSGNAYKNPVCSTGSAGVLGKKGPKVKEEDIVELVGEDSERTCPSHFSAPPEMFIIEGLYPAASWEQATIDAIMTLRSSGTAVTTTQIAQTVIANLKDENDFLRVQNVNLRSELRTKQWLQEQELRNLQERLDTLEHKCRHNRHRVRGIAIPCHGNIDNINMYGITLVGKWKFNIMLYVTCCGTTK